MRTIEQILSHYKSRQDWLVCIIEEYDRQYPIEKLNDPELIVDLIELIDYLVNQNFDYMEEFSTEELDLIINYYNGSILSLIPPGIFGLLEALFYRIVKPRLFKERIALVALTRLVPMEYL